MNITRALLFLFFTSALAACATTQPPTQKLTETETVIRQADQIGANDYAPLEIREARQKPDRAKAAMDREDYEAAARLAEQARADSVRRALLERGISSNRIQTIGYGEHFPVATNQTESGRQQNRRVEVIISDQEGNIPERKN